MTTETLSEDVLNKVTRSLVIRQKGATRDQALQQLALAAVSDKIAHYRRRIRKLGRKYSTDFSGFTDLLRGKATPAQEDDWLSWKTATRMLADWQRARQDLLDADTLGALK
jgi:hypothetical protein